MYLKSIYCENNGPLRQFAFTLPFDENRLPKPLVLVGRNGSGKTTFLSTIADGLFEAAAAHYQDATSYTRAGARSWFRLVGMQTISVGASGACSLLEFVHNDRPFFYKEKGGQLRAADVAERAPSIFRPVISWDEVGNTKKFDISDPDARDIFEAGAYTYFPSSRFEVPHWLNEEGFGEEVFDFSENFAGRIRKPIYIQRGLKQLKQWLLGLLTDSRVDIARSEDGEDGTTR
jgi:energy-coupling factor transporter ATP-binding protein EcfA2